MLTISPRTITIPNPTPAQVRLTPGMEHLDGDTPTRIDSTRYTAR